MVLLTLKMDSQRIPERIEGELLDRCLERGFYRMQQDMFTTNLIIQEESVMPVHWLRTRLSLFNHNSSTKEILRKNKKFSAEISPFQYSVELEDLFSLYKTGISFTPSASVASYLFEDEKQHRFNTWMIQLRDRGLLIGAGIFDVGMNSIAGIMNIYHPDYKKHSIGKWLMLQKMEFAKNIGAEFYYTGYISPGTPRFDYKLFPSKDCIEIWNPDAEVWFPYNLFPVK